MIELKQCGLYNTQFLSNLGIKKSDNRKTKFFEIEFILDATGTGYINNQVYKLKPNTIMLAKPGCSRFSYFDFKCYFLYVDISQDDKYYSLLSKAPDLYINIDSSKYLRIFKTAFELKEKGVEIDSDIFKALTLELLYYLSDDIAPNILLNNQHSNFKLIDQCISYFQENYSEKITLNDLSEHFNYSPNYIQSRFKKYLGITPLNFLESYRLEESKKLLLLSNNNILNIAVECGFASESYFINRFKAKYGLTPKQFRKQSIKNFLR